MCTFTSAASIVLKVQVSARIMVKYVQLWHWLTEATWESQKGNIYKKEGIFRLKGQGHDIQWSFALLFAPAKNGHCSRKCRGHQTMTARSAAGTASPAKLSRENVFFLEQLSFSAALPYGRHYFSHTKWLPKNHRLSWHCRFNNNPRSIVQESYWAAYFLVLKTVKCGLAHTLYVFHFRSGRRPRIRPCRFFPCLSESLLFTIALVLIHRFDIRIKGLLGIRLHSPVEAQGQLRLDKNLKQMHGGCGMINSYL